jgi:hypothetical protein
MEVLGQLLGAPATEAILSLVHAQIPYMSLSRNGQEAESMHTAFEKDVEIGSTG